MKELSQKLEKDEEARATLEEMMQISHLVQQKETEGKPIEPDEKKKLTELQEKAKETSLIGEYMATQAYYFDLLSKVNEVIANPQGDPPKDSDIILPGDNKNVIIP